MTQKAVPQPGIDAFHRERSKCLDAFVAAEEAVVELLVRSGSKVSSEPYSRKIDRLRKAEPSPNFSADLKIKIEPLLLKFIELMALRNDLVHARLQIARIGDAEKACFINASECTNGSQTARLFSLDSLRGVTKSATQLAKELNAA